MFTKRFKNVSFVVVSLFFAYIVFFQLVYRSLIDTSSSESEINKSVIVEHTDDQNEIRIKASNHVIIEYLKFMNKCKCNKTTDHNVKKSTHSIKPVPVSQTTTEPTRLSYLDKYPYLLDCKTNYNKIDPSQIKFVDELSYQNTYNYMQPASNSTHSQRILRAVVIYFPIVSVDHFKSEFKWLYRSWIYMQTFEPSKWRTDLIVFIDTNSTNKEFDKPDFFLNELNCTTRNMRTSPEQKPMCTIIGYKAVKDRQDKFIVKNKPEIFEKSILDHLIHDVDVFEMKMAHYALFLSLLMSSMESYSYLDSILIGFEGYSYFKSAGFDFLIRSDMDVFLTPALATWLPRYCNDFYVGGGAYSNTFNRKRLNRIANNMGLKYAQWSNLGSTWISTPEQFRLVSYLTLIGMAYLAHDEFTEPERKGQVGTINWPEWHYGVLLLYGQNLALNHLIATNQINMVRLHNYIDYPSGNTNSVFGVLHLHVYHGGKII